jgi:two-component system sensor histidine kinase KdpD
MEMGDTLTPAQERELLESVLSEAQRLNNYTQNLLDMTRLGRGELRLDRSWVSIEEIVNVTLKRIRPLAESHHLHVRMATPLPLLRVHPALIEQAIFNVLHNALKFSPAGTDVILSCYAEQPEVAGQGSQLVIEISDQGPGIEESEREKVFRMFHTAEQGDRRVAGSGLGLAICRGMIGAHGGSVSVSEGPAGRGCLVRIKIPVAALDENEVGGSGIEQDTDH